MNGRQLLVVRFARLNDRNVSESGKAAIRLKWPAPVSLQTAQTILPPPNISEIASVGWKTAMVVAIYVAGQVLPSRPNSRSRQAACSKDVRRFYCPKSSMAASSSRYLIPRAACTATLCGGCGLSVVGPVRIFAGGIGSGRGGRGSCNKLIY